jgi:hypothetical protein
LCYFAEFSAGWQQCWKTQLLMKVTTVYEARRGPNSEVLAPPPTPTPHPTPIQRRCLTSPLHRQYTLTEIKTASVFPLKSGICFNC